MIVWMFVRNNQGQLNAFNNEIHYDVMHNLELKRRIGQCDDLWLILLPKKWNSALITDEGRHYLTIGLCYRCYFLLFYITIDKWRCSCCVVETVPWKTSEKNLFIMENWTPDNYFLSSFQKEIILKYILIFYI